MSTESQFIPDLSDYLSAIKRRHFVLLAIALPIAAVGIVLAIGLPSIYQSTGTIQFNPATISGQLQNGGPQSAYVDLQRNYADQYVANLREAVLNPANLAPVVDQVRALPGMPADRDAVFAWIAEHTAIVPTRAKVLDPDSGHTRDVVPGFTVSFSSRDPQTAQRVASLLTDGVMQASRHNLLVRARAADQFYQKEADRYRAQISTLETELAEFKQKHFNELPELTNSNINNLDRLRADEENVQLQMNQIRQNRTFLLQELQQAQSVANSDSTTLQRLEAEYSQKAAIYGENHPDLVSLRRQIQAMRSQGAGIEGLGLPQQLAAQEQQLRTLRQRYSDDYPDVRDVKARIAELKRRIASGEKSQVIPDESPTVVQLRTALEGNQNQMASLQQNAAELRRQIASFEKSMASTPMVEKQYQQLTSGLQIAHTKLDELIKGMMDSQVTAQAIMSGRADELRVLNPPIVPDAPAKPNRAAIAVIGVVVALVLALSVVVATETLDQTVRGSRDVRRVLSLAPLAVIPRIQDPASLRWQRFKVVALAGGVVACSAIVLLTVRSHI